MVVKTIVVRNLFSYEYDGSNPSLPTIKTRKLVFIFFNTNEQKFNKGGNMKFTTNKEKGNTGLGIAGTKGRTLFMSIKFADI